MPIQAHSKKAEQVIGETIQHVNDYYKSDGYTPLMRAVYNNDMAMVNILLKEPDIDVNKYSSQDYLGNPRSKRLYDITAIGIATMLGHTQIIDELLKVRGIRAKTLYRKNRCSDMYKKYLTKSPKIKHQKLHRIMLATLGIIKSDEDSEPEEESEEEEEVDDEKDSDYEEEDLFDAQTINKYDKNGYTPLIRAVYKRDLGQVKRLLHVPSIDVNQYSSNAHHGHTARKYMTESTALSIAKWKGYTEIVDELLKVADPTKLDYYD